MKGSPQQGALVLQITVGSGGGILRGVLDITSELVWVQCGHCRTCLRLTPRGTRTFLPDVSPSFARVGCGSKLCERVVNGHQPNCDATSKSACMYRELFFGGDQYTSGFLATESFTFGATTTAGVVFGCSANITVLGLAAGASGFLGFNRGPFSLTSQLNISGFSYFISHKDSSKSFFSFWADPACAVSVHQQPGKHTRYTPLLQPTANQNPYLYYVNLIGVKVDGQLLTAIPAGTFDVRVKDGSGGVYLSTTVPVTYLEEAAYSVLRQELVTRIQSQGVSPVSVDDDPLCYMTRSYKNIKVPRLALVFDGADATMNLYTKNYFLPVDGGQTCFTILPSNGGSVLGSLLQAGRTITYNDINGDGGSLSFD